MLAPSHRSEIELVQVSAKGSWIVHANRHHSYSIHGHPHAQCGRAYRPRHPSHRSRRRRQRFWSRWKPYPEGSVEAAGSLSLGRCPVLTTSESSRRIHRNRCRQALEEHCITSNKSDFEHCTAHRESAPLQTRRVSPLQPRFQRRLWRQARRRWLGRPSRSTPFALGRTCSSHLMRLAENGTLHQLYAEGNIKPEQ
jgi:hypothetical protein